MDGEEVPLGDVTKPPGWWELITQTAGHRRDGQLVPACRVLYAYVLDADACHTLHHAYYQFVDTRQLPVISIDDDKAGRGTSDQRVVVGVGLAGGRLVVA